MTLPKPLSLQHRVLWITGAGALAAVVIATFYPYGQMGLTYDSTDLIEGSESLQTYLSGKNKDGHSYLVRAPLHPFLFSFFHDKLAAIWWINLLAMLTSFSLIFALAKSNGLSNTLSFLAVCITGIFVPWLVNFQYVWTEPVFIALILWLCWALVGKWSFAWVIVICVLLFLTRKSGLFFFPAVSILYLHDKKTLQAVIIMSAGIFLFIVWEWLEFTFASTGFFSTMLVNLQGYKRIYFLEAFTSWFFPLQIPLLFRTCLTVSVITIALIWFKREIFSVVRERPNVVLLMVSGVYCFILIIFRGISEYEDGERYLSIFFPLLVIVGASVISAIVTTAPKIVRNFVFLGVGLWLLYCSLRTVHHLFWPVV